MLDDIEKLALDYIEEIALDYNSSSGSWLIQIIKYDGENIDDIYEYGIYDITQTKLAIATFKIVFNKMNAKLYPIIEKHKSKNLMLWDMCDLNHDPEIRVLLFIVPKSPLLKIGIQKMIGHFNIKSRYAT